jgi:hypothetical protein
MNVRIQLHTTFPNGNNCHARPVTPSQSPVAASKRGEFMAERCPHCGASLPLSRDAFCPECRGDLSEPAALPRFPEAEEKDSDPELRVLYATPERLRKLVKLSWYDDRGSLGLAREGVVFAGRIGVLPMPQLRSVQPPSLVIPWGAFVSMLLGNVLVLLMPKAGAFQILTLNNPMTYVVLGVLDVLAPCCWPMQWIRVDYVDAQGREQTAYFTSASIPARWSGGPKRLHGWISDAFGFP